VTFGTLQPVVLLPDGLRGHARHIQRAVISHELFHVLRRDWLWTLSEEIVRAVFWFHPAIWWVISRVQLTREEAVDELVVLATGQRRTYLEALLAFADEAPLAPAAAFARRRHLYRRMMLISKEAVMSSRRVVITCAVLAVLVAAGSWYAVGAFPMLQAQEAQGLLNEPGPIEQRARPITPENPIPRRVYAAPAHYPQEAIGTGAEETVTLRITLNELGRVAEVRRIATRAPGTSPALTEAFVKSAADAVRQWIFDAPADGPLAFNVTLRFAPEAEAILTAMGVGGAFSPPTGAIGGPDRGSAAGRTGRPGRTGGAGFGAAAPPPPPPPPSPDGFVRVGGAIRPPTKVKTVNPAYPLEAQEAKVQGVVILEAVIDPSGFVSDARVLRSIPLLDQAALDAVRQWEFTPTRLNGVPVSVIMTVTVAFTLT
jgi:TonB family protein